MNQLTIELRDGKTQFRPGEMIQGAAYWKFPSAPKSLEARLFWHTRGKGTEDVLILDSYAFANAKSEEARPFEFEAPEAPYSFSGKLVSVIWALELVAKPGEESQRVDITISPTGKEVVLGTVHESPR